MNCQHDMKDNNKSSKGQTNAKLEGQKTYPINGSPGNFVISGVQGQAAVGTITDAFEKSRPTASKRKAESDTEPSEPKCVKVQETPVDMDIASDNATCHSARLEIFQYLEIQELLRAACVTRTWRDSAGHKSLWRTVRLKNSHKDDWQGLIDTLSCHHTQHLDLCKMILPNTVPENEQMWRDFGQAISCARSLTMIELCRCPPFVIEDIANACPQLTVLNALTIQCQTTNLTCLGNLKNLVELKLKSMNGTLLEKSLQPIKELIHLKHLAMTRFKQMGQAGCENFKYLTNLEQLELGECLDLPENFGEDVLMKLTKLERLRLEKGQGKFCHTFRLLAAIKELPKLSQLELINFDVKVGFDTAMGQCSNLKRLLIIPTYVTQSATTNYLILEGATKLKETLSLFVWGVTQELLHATKWLFEQSALRDSTEKGEKVSDSIPILKHGSLERQENLENLSNEELKDERSQVGQVEMGQVEVGQVEVGQVEIKTLFKLQMLLMAALPNTKIRIVRTPFQATWEQTLEELLH